MIPHKFNVGARVQYVPPYAAQSNTGGEFTVERQLPPDGEGNQYRIESRSDGHRRVVHEINLVRAGSSF
jgi:hypothetical protein